VTSTGFIHVRRVQFAETDAAGVLHFSNYYRMMEEAEHAFWRSLDMSVVFESDEGEISWPRVATSCEYYAPVRFQDELELALRITHMGNRSLSFEIEFRHERQLIALGRTTAVCCTMCDGIFQPVAIPQAVRTKIAPLVTTET